MSSPRRFFLRLRNALVPGRGESDLAREVASHLALLEDEFRRRGMSAEDARRAARRAFGGVEQAKEAHRDARSFVWIDDVRRDVRHAGRVLLRSRSFSTAAILTIALGIGLSSTIFAVVDGVLFRPLPYREAARLVAVYGAVPAENDWLLAVSYPDLVDWRASARSLVQLEGYDLGGAPARLRAADETTQVPSAAVTSGFLGMLSVEPELGRPFVADDFKPGAPAVALISDRVWRARFGAQPDILGKIVERGKRSAAIVGVLPRSFVFPTPSRRLSPEVLVPFEANGPVKDDRTDRSLYLIGRLAPGASLEQARTELDHIALRLKPLFVGRPNTFPGAFDAANVIDLRTQLTQASSHVAWLVFGAAAVVFLIACINVVALSMAHNEDRRRELAVRAAIGASRHALVRQLLAEAGVLAAAGAAAGWLVSAATFGLVMREIPRWLQLVGDPGMNGRTMMFAGIMMLVTLIVAGLAPALRASAEVPRTAMPGIARHATPFGRGRYGLLMVESALAMLLLCAGAIMFHGWLTLNAQQSGMDSANVIAVRATPAGLNDAPHRARFNTRMADVVRRLPGVQDVAFLDMPPLQSAVRGSWFVPPARVTNAAGMDTDVKVTPNYFATMGIPIRSGRALNERDRGRSVVISQALADRYWPGRNPVGETIRYGNGMRDIVGVAANARDVSFDRPPTPTLYHVWDERDAPIATLIVRFGGSPDRVLAGIRRAVHTADPQAAITMLSTIDDLLALSIAPRTFNTLLFTVFGVAGLLVALAGIYGLVSFLVVRREREMGIRLALGATSTGLRAFVIATTLRWVVAGIVIGGGGALVCAQYLRPFVYGIPPNDPPTLGVAALGFIAIAVVASYIPARRASRVDPLVSLRAE